MRKTARKMMLHRETLQQLDGRALGVAGGSGVHVTYDATCGPTREFSICLNCETQTNCQISACICA